MKQANTIKVTSINNDRELSISFTDNHLTSAKYCYVETFEDHFVVYNAMDSYEGNRTKLDRAGHSVYTQVSTFRNKIQTGTYIIDLEESDADEIHVYYEDLV